MLSRNIFVSNAIDSSMSSNAQTHSFISFKDNFFLESKSTILHLVVELHSKFMLYISFDFRGMVKISMQINLFEELIKIKNTGLLCELFI